MKRYHAEIDGMGCARCVQRVTEALTALGAQALEVALGRADFCFDGEPAAVKEAIEDCGFELTDIAEA